MIYLFMIRKRNNYQDGIVVKKSELMKQEILVDPLGNQKFSAVTKQLDIITGNESFEDSDEIIL